jgi:ABC-type multidrug transport system fused ATPase/permease subunit
MKISEDIYKANSSRKERFIHLWWDFNRLAGPKWWKLWGFLFGSIWVILWIGIVVFWCDKLQLSEDAVDFWNILVFLLAILSAYWPISRIGRKIENKQRALLEKESQERWERIKKKSEEAAVKIYPEVLAIKKSGLEKGKNTDEINVQICDLAEQNFILRETYGDWLLDNGLLFDKNFRDAYVQVLLVRKYGIDDGKSFDEINEDIRNIAGFNNIPEDIYFDWLLGDEVKQIKEIREAKSESEQERIIDRIADEILERRKREDAGKAD